MIRMLHNYLGENVMGRMLTSGPSTSEFIFICLPSRARKQGIDELWVVEMNFMRIDAHYWDCIQG
jgi:hypothetical protein